MLVIFIPLSALFVIFYCFVLSSWTHFARAFALGDMDSHWSLSRMKHHIFSTMFGSLVCVWHLAYECLKGREECVPRYGQCSPNCEVRPHCSVVLCPSCMIYYSRKVRSRLKICQFIDLQQSECTPRGTMPPHTVCMGYCVHFSQIPSHTLHLDHCMLWLQASWQHYEEGCECSRLKITYSRKIIKLKSKQ